MNDFDKQLLCDFMDISLMKLDSKYLGLPSFWGKSKSEAYVFLVEKSLGKMQGWKVKQMSQGGKEIMLKSVVQAIRVMLCLAFFSLKNCVTSLTLLFQNFGGKEIQRERKFIGRIGIL